MVMARGLLAIRKLTKKQKRKKKHVTEKGQLHFFQRQKKRSEKICSKGGNDGKIGGKKKEQGDPLAFKIKKVT